MITQRVSVPTIGIGAGPFCSGQVQVWHDVLGLFDNFKPKHARRFAEVGQTIRDALAEYRTEVEAGSFPTAKESFYMDERALKLIEKMAPPLPDVDIEPQDADDILDDAREMLERSRRSGGASTE